MSRTDSGRNVLPDRERETRACVAALVERALLADGKKESQEVRGISKVTHRGI